MDDIIDISDTDDDHDAITETSVGGLLGGQLLADDPVSAYLGDEETVQYVLRNKKSGYSVEDDESREEQPGGDYQALAVVTDLRILFVVGREDGNHTDSLALEDIFEARVGSGGFRTDVLEVEDFDDRIWQFPVKADPSSVASAVDALAQSWVSAVRLVNDAEAELEDATAVLPDQPGDAGTMLDEAESNLRLAHERIQDVGPGAVAEITERAGDLADRLRPLRRRQAAEYAASAQARGHDAWDQGDFEAASTAYADAVEQFETALEMEGETPPNDILSRRLRAAVAERELLRVAPVFEADASRRLALAAEDPETAARYWEQTLEGYLDSLSIEFDDVEREFVVDTEHIQDQASSVATDAIADYYEAGTQHLIAGDERPDEDGRTEEYEQARSLFEQAQRLAEEVEPDVIDTIETALFTVERRLEGNVPADPADPVVPPLEFDRDEEESDDESAASEEATAPGRSGPKRRTSTETASVPEQGPVSGQGDSPSPLDQIKSQKVAETNDGGDSDAETGPAPAAEKPAPTETHALLRSLDEESFTEYVADLWEAQGWSTTVFSATPDSVYDIVAMREDPEEERLLLWTVHRPHGGDLGSTIVKRCATSRESSQGTDNITLVTSGSLTTTAERRAIERDVTVVDCDSLVDRIETAGFVEELRDRTE